MNSCKMTKRAHRTETSHKGHTTRFVKRKRVIAAKDYMTRVWTSEQGQRTTDSLLRTFRFFAISIQVSLMAGSLSLVCDGCP